MADGSATSSPNSSDEATGTAGPSDDPPGAGGGSEFAAFVDDELDFEMVRNERAEARGERLLTASSTLVTLAFAGAAVVGGGEAFNPPRLTLWLMIPASLSLLLAAGLGLRASRVTSIRRAGIDLLRKWDAQTPTMWNARQEAARQLITGAKITALGSLRDANDAKMKPVIWGGRAQGAGLVFLTLASSVILLHAASPNARWWWDMLQPLGS